MSTDSADTNPAPANVTPIDPPTLTTKRLVIRPYRLRDADETARLAGHEKVVDTTLNIPSPYTPDAARDWIGTHDEMYQTGAGVSLRIGLKDSDAHVGGVGLRVNSRHSKAELGYWIAVDHWNQGYATEAAGAMLEYGFNTLNLNRVYAHYMMRNPASGRVMQKLGMAREGRLRHHVRKNDAYEDLELYGMLRSDWQKRQQGSSP
ncbi:MAG: N-acetyltransferase [Planctomycetes bacterium]|nr:N-acetyltransferase [Planctomycetota bacterium]NOG55819.1 GNAT family N-acetyltransferase [Planctomycetota bacterium]